MSFASQKVSPPPASLTDTSPLWTIQYVIFSFSLNNDGRAVLMRKWLKFSKCIMVVFFCLFFLQFVSENSDCTKKLLQWSLKHHESPHIYNISLSKGLSQKHESLRFTVGRKVGTLKSMWELPHHHTPPKACWLSDRPFTSGTNQWAKHANTDWQKHISLESLAMSYIYS